MLFPDPWVSPAAVVGATTTIRLGALVSCVAYRHPRGTLRLAAEHADVLNIGPASWAGGAYSTDDVEDGYQYLVFFTADAFTGSRGMTDRLLTDVLPRVRRDVRSQARVEA